MLFIVEDGVQGPNVSPNLANPPTVRSQEAPLASHAQGANCERQPRPGAPSVRFEAHVCVLGVTPHQNQPRRMHAAAAAVVLYILLPELKPRKQMNPRKQRGSKRMKEDAWILARAKTTRGI